MSTSTISTTTPPILLKEPIQPTFKEKVKLWFKPIVDFFLNLWYYLKTLYWKIKIIKSSNDCDRLNAKWHIENPDTGIYTVAEMIKNPELCKEMEVLSDLTKCGKIDMLSSIELKKKACTDDGRLKFNWEGLNEGGTDGYSYDQIIKSEQKCKDLQKLIDMYKDKTSVADIAKLSRYQKMFDDSCRQC
jgi:hypothetical protein